MKDDLPQPHFGTATDTPVDWRRVRVDESDDDEQLKRTPPDVVEMLGFDPLDVDAEGDELKKYNPNHVPAGSPEGGQFTSGEGGAAGALPARGTREHTNRVLAAAQYAAIKQGYNPSKIVVSDEDYKYTLDGRTFTPGAVAYIYPEGDQPQGTIKVFSQGYEPHHVDQIPGAIAHEIEHIKFQTVLDRAAAEGQQLEAEAQRIMDGGGTWRDLPIHADDTVKPEYAGRWPYYEAMHPYMSETDKLRENDGVSDYSREWWAAEKAGKVTPMQAVHETLAEMAKNAHIMKGEALIVGADGVRSTTGGDKIWRDLYGTVDHLYGRLKSEK